MLADRSKERLQQCAQHGAPKPDKGRDTELSDKSGGAASAAVRLPLTATALTNGGRPRAPPVPQPAAKRACAGLRPPDAVLGEPDVACASTATTPGLRRHASSPAMRGEPHRLVAGTSPWAEPQEEQGRVRVSAATSHVDPGAAHGGLRAAGAVRARPRDEQPPTRADTGVGTSPGLRAFAQTAQAGMAQPLPSQEAELRVASLAREPSTAAKQIDHVLRETGSQQAQVLEAVPDPQDSVALPEHQSSQGRSAAAAIFRGQQRATSTAASPDKGACGASLRAHGAARRAASHSRHADAGTLVTPRLRAGAATSQAGAARGGPRGAAACEASPAPAEVRGDSLQSLSAQDLASVPAWSAPAARRSLPGGTVWQGFSGGSPAQARDGHMLSPEQALARMPQPRGAARLFEQGQGRRSRSLRATAQEVLSSLYGGGSGHADDEVQIVAIGCAPARASEHTSCTLM